MHSRAAVTVVPSLLSCDHSNLLSAVQPILSDFSVPWMHFDAIDGLFAPAYGFCPQSLLDLRSAIKRQLNRCPKFAVHLMVQQPNVLWSKFAESGAEEIVLHLESPCEIVPLARKIESSGIRCGLAINPETPFAKCAPLLRHFSSLLVLAVNPGFGGQDTIPGTVEKIIEAAGHREKSHRHYDIAIDGGIHFKNAELFANAGADFIVSGSAIFCNGCQRNAYEQLTNILRGTREGVGSRHRRPQHSASLE
ncbi:MAG: ribulose-phosphate 3-epimerase [Puniceicoccales bacterium]|nr:ribulose-phosphate 3-epimerase [Puniceicoccales bacterium]